MTEALSTSSTSRAKRTTTPEIWKVELWARWAGKFHRVRYNGSQGPEPLGWHFVSHCGAWENLGRANIHHKARVRQRTRIVDVPRRSDRCLNCTTKPVSRDSGYRRLDS